ncbi:hypothetical protein BN1723_008394 [Verticillium longisporum]|uniref:Uncharacterized protein n=1 Tax=Verticillium longisporum TaxID=100787 RepID=A0A0G4NRI8_VERLO|nr:hypothetical protein BN1723_008394 [Verticillium longisporum]
MACQEQDSKALVFSSVVRPAQSTYTATEKFEGQETGFKPLSVGLQVLDKVVPPLWRPLKNLALASIWPTNSTDSISPGAYSIGSSLLYMGPEL